MTGKKRILTKVKQEYNKRWEWKVTSEKKCRPRQTEESDQQRANLKNTDKKEERQRDAGVLNEVPRVEGGRGTSLPCSVTN